MGLGKNLLISTRVPNLQFLTFWPVSLLRTKSGISCFCEKWAAGQFYWHEIRRRRKSPHSPFGFGRASEGGPRRRNFVSLRGKQKFLLFACFVASRRRCYGARPNVWVLGARSAPSVSFKIGSDLVKQTHQQKTQP